MFSNKEEDMVEEAIEQMEKIILRLVEESYQGNNFDKSIDCL